MARFRLCIVFVVASACLGQIESNASDIPESEMRHLLTQICPGHEGDSACSVCPEGTSSQGSPEAWNVGTVFYGHFLSASSRDVLVNGSGCEPHSQGMSGSVLLTRKQNSWRRVRYLSGTRAGDCRQLPGSDGRDRLVCAQTDGHYGFNETTLSLFDPVQDRSSSGPQDKGFGIVFLSLLDTTDAGACHPYIKDDDAAEGLLQSATVENVEFIPLRAKYQVRIVVSSAEGSMEISKTLRDQICAGSAPEPDVTRLIKSTRYEFIFNGKEINPVKP
jgi:hypothetical protein